MSEGMRFRMEFGGAELPLVRSLVEEAALRARLTHSVKGAFVQAALEISTNAVIHGGGSGSVELLVVEGELRCEVTDDGPGPPASGEPGLPAAWTEGHGLRLAESLIGATGRIDATGRVGATGRIGIRDAHRDTRRGTTVALSVPLPALVGAAPATIPPAR